MTMSACRLYIRPIVQDDVRALHAVRGDPDVMIHSSRGLPSANLDETQEWLDRVLSLNQPFFAICLSDAPGNAEVTSVQYTKAASERDVIGSVGLVTEHPPEVGYSIRKDRWGQGYTSKALRAFCDWYRTQAEEREDWQLCLTAIVEERNKASRRVLQKGGFAQIPGEEWMSKPDHRGELKLLRYVLS